MPTDAGDHANEVSQGRRFEFGKNWRAYAELVDRSRIEAARRQLSDALGVESLAGLRFLDVGTGSGIDALAARELGATVHAFDFDPDSVAAAQSLRAKFRPDDEDWAIEGGSVLDRHYLGGLGQFDVVYAWGVLHHTGELWNACRNVAELVAPSGQLHLALYNYQVYWSRLYTQLKRGYVRSNRTGKTLLAGAFAGTQVTKGLLKDLALRRDPMQRYRDKKLARGMSAWHDWLDWLGGYPFEVSKPEEVFDFYAQRGFDLEFLKTAGGGHGCNEFVFRRAQQSSSNTSR